MNGLLTFGEFMISQFGGFYEWFMNSSLQMGGITIAPYQIFGLGTLIIIIGFLIVRLVVGG